jgi:hypothetical protein
MQGLRHMRGVVSALTLGLHLFTVAHMVLVDHTLTPSGEVVDAAQVSTHEHDGASLCGDEASDSSQASCEAWTRFSRAELNRVEVVSPASPVSFVMLVERSVLVPSRPPLSWAPKASPPRS